MAINSNFELRGKNQTPHQMALVSAIVSAIFYTCVILTLDALGLLRISLRGILLLSLIAVIIDYFANFYFVRYYIFRRIKLIYKIIHKQKSSPDFKKESIDMYSDVIGDVEREVGEWAISRENEIKKLESLAAYRRQYIGDISHELKTPLFSALGFVHTLLEGGLHDDTINKNYLERAAQNLERLQTIVDDLDIINRLEQGDTLLDLTTFDMKKLCIEVFNDLELKAAKRRIKLAFKDSASENWMVRADKERIRQVLINLVHNSIKYGTEGGTTKISFYDMEKYLLVEVADNGIGIAEEHLNHVFDRFYRVDKSRSRDVGGTGLGLAIVKHIIEAHGQTINVRSSSGQGSTFGFTVQKA